MVDCTALLCKDGTTDESTRVGMRHISDAVVNKMSMIRQTKREKLLTDTSTIQCFGQPASKTHYLDYVFFLL